MKLPKLSKKIKALVACISVATAISFPIVSFGALGEEYAAAMASFGAWTSGAYTAQVAMTMESFSIESMAAVAQSKIQQYAQSKLAELSNLASAELQKTIGSAVIDNLKAIVAGPAGKELANNGLTVGDVVNQAGKSSTATQQAGQNAIVNAKNANESIAMQTKLMLEQQLADRMNVTSILDDKPDHATCKSAQGDKCTVITYLKESEAEATDLLRKRSVAAMLNSMSHGDNWKSQLLKQIYDPATGSKGTQKVDVVEFLTASNAIPTAVKVTPNAMDLKRSQTLTDALVGTRNDTELKDYKELNQLGTNDASQLDAMSRIAKVQLARVAISAVHNEASQQQLSAQYRACAMRPDAKDRIGSTEEQQLVHLQSLMRCTNMSLIQMEQRAMEEQRLQGAILLTLLDIFAVQAPTTSK